METGTSRLNTIQLFCTAARTLSFTKAAEECGLSPSAVSKAVSRLESQLGVKLFDRTTRAIRLTEEGQTYFDTCEQALRNISQAEAALAQGHAKASGTLRVSLPPSFGILQVVPLLPKYLEQQGHELNVVVAMSNSITEFVTQGCDVAIRLGHVTDGRIVARHLRDARFCVVASPAYLLANGVPTTPDDIRSHRAVDLVITDTGKPLPWEFADGGRLFTVAMRPSLSVNDPVAALTASIAGGGFARLLDFTVERAIQEGSVIEVLQDFRPPGIPVSVVYPGHRHMPARVRSFIDFLVKAFASP